MPTKKKKAGPSTEDETKDADDDDPEGQEAKTDKKSKKVSESRHAGRLKKQLKVSEEEGYNSDTSAPDVKSAKTKRKKKETSKKKKKKARGESEDENSESTDNENNNNDAKRGQKVSGVLEKPPKRYQSKGRMGSKDKKSKGEDRKSKKESEKEDEDQTAGDEEEGKKKKKDKKKKGSEKGDSDEDNRKTKGKKKKVENYVEIYENELLNYEPEKVENHEDEYHRKKGKWRVNVKKRQIKSRMLCLID